MRLKATISIILLLSGCAVSQKNEISQEIEIPVPESVVAEVDTQLYQEEKSKIMALFDDALQRVEEAPNDAIRLYEEAIRVAPNRWETYYNTGIMYMKLNAPENAIEEFMIAFKYRAPPAKIYNALGTVYLTMGEETTAIKILERALAYKKSPDTMINIANIYQSMGQTEKAIEYYSKAEVLAPSNQIMHYNMGILLYNMGDYKRAQEEFNKLLEYGEREGRTLLWQARTLLRLGDYEDALKIYQEMTYRDPADPDPYKEMGIIYEIYLGDMEKALESYTSYIDRGGKKSKEVKLWIEVVRARLNRES